MSTSQPILNLGAVSSSPKKTTAHLLPCKIHHTGPVEPTRSFWDPQPSASSSDTKEAYFRGRKLKGKSVALPEGYKGVVAISSLPDQNVDADVIDLEKDSHGKLEVQAEFDEVVVWGHESLADAGADGYVRSLEEWVGVAGAIHCFDQGANK
ncbi:ribonuclease H2, subunit C [Triangularia verruculosa]|uniref:Ribonuclease H2, subunit C n=1 Tax=Triangularia verruculosa TaxID=2587418 RepID=A0AAN7AX38_9PEZI|nr:ribonuclease H2, subunit C [Triangularia verruculosa]